MSFYMKKHTPTVASTLCVCVCFLWTWYILDDGITQVLCNLCLHNNNYFKCTSRVTRYLGKTNSSIRLHFVNIYKHIRRTLWKIKQTFVVFINLTVDCSANRIIVNCFAPCNLLEQKLQENWKQCQLYYLLFVCY